MAGGIKGTQHSPLGAGASCHSTETSSRRAVSWGQEGLQGQPHLTRQACEDGTGLCFHHKQARHIRLRRQSFLVLPWTTKRQLGSRQTSEALRGLAPRSLESPSPFSQCKHLNISSREMWRLPIFWKEKQCSDHMWNSGASQGLLCKVSPRLETIWKRGTGLARGQIQEDMSKGK